MRVESTQHLDRTGREIYYTLENEDGSYAGTFSSLEEAWEFTEEFEEQPWAICSWSVLKGDVIFINDLMRIDK